MRLRPAALPLLAGALLLGACSDAGDTTDDGATGTPTPTATATEGGTAAADPTRDELVSEDLPEGVAATVDDTEIAVETLEERLDVIRAIPDVAQQLEGESGAQAEARIQSQALSQLVLQRVVLQGAAQEDIEVDDAQVQDRRAEMEESAGGEEAFAEQLATSGVPEGQIAQQLRAIIAFEIVTEQLLADAGVDPQATETPSEGATVPASPNAQQTQQLQQDWLLDLISSTEIVVDEAYGAWDPASGQVVPA